MLQTIVSVAVLAMYSRHEARPDDCLTLRDRAGLLGNEVAHPPALARRVFRQLRLPPALGPGAFVGALVRGLGSVVEAEGLVTALAEEGEKVELVAVVELAVLADERGVIANAALNFGHFEVTCFSVGGRHDGRIESRDRGEYIRAWRFRVPRQNIWASSSRRQRGIVIVVAVR